MSFATAMTGMQIASTVLNRKKGPKRGFFGYMAALKDARRAEDEAVQKGVDAGVARIMNNYRRLNPTFTKSKKKESDFVRQLQDHVRLNLGLSPSVVPQPTLMESRGVRSTTPLNVDFISSPRDNDPPSGSSSSSGDISFVNAPDK